MIKSESLSIPIDRLYLCKKLRNYQNDKNETCGLVQDYQNRIFFVKKYTFIYNLNDRKLKK